jgi:hypothetical protein
MSIKILIRHLKGSDIGKIYWHNFCVQYRANLLDEKISQQVFRSASVNNDYRKEVDNHAAGHGSYDLSYHARQALYIAANENMYAISASRFMPKLSDLPSTVSTVISDTTFERYCVKTVPGLSNTLIQLLIRLGASTIPPGVGLRHIFAEMHARGITRINDLPGAAKNILPFIVIKTKPSRFWLAGDPQGFPDDPDAVRDLFGLGYLKKGDWLIRISMPTSALYKELGTNASMVKRPSAFCVNDDVAPRFRGVTVEDHIRYPVTPLTRHGTTINLNKVEKGQFPDDGESEWICPQVAFRNDEIKFDLLGDIKADRLAPSNKAYFDKYLKVMLPLSKNDEKSVIAALMQV